MKNSNLVLHLLVEGSGRVTLFQSHSLDLVQNVRRFGKRHVSPLTKGYYLFPEAEECRGGEIDHIHNIPRKGTAVTTFETTVERSEAKACAFFVQHNGYHLH